MSNIYRVSDVNKYIKMIMEKDQLLSNISIKGEITNFKAHYSGHLYFTLKDEAATIKCVMFKGYAALSKVVLKDGVSVILSGSISAYERDGVYQLYVKSAAIDGIGDLYQKYEELKLKLKNEGLFDPSAKKEIPFLPSRVGVITSRTGAVIRDIINVSTRRYNNVNLLVYPAAVQGVSVAETVIAGIRKFNSMDVGRPDVIIIARGGGSFEDLFGFNDENLAREIYKSEIPIVSAVGHETDFTICDFVSDLRVPTPSAAAELVCPSKLELISKIDNLKSRLSRSILNTYSKKEQYLEKLSMKKLKKIPKSMIEKYYLVIDSYIKSMETSINKKYQNNKNIFEKHVALLDSYSPLKTLSRGYTVIQDGRGNVITKKENVHIGDVIKNKLIDGEFISVVEKIV